MSAKKMQFIQEVDAHFRPAPTHIYSLEYCRKYLTNKKVLDVGCWNGDFESLLGKIKTKLIGIDPDKQALKVAQRKYPQFDFRYADVHKKLPFKKEFDTVVLWMTMEHLDNEKIALTNINRVMRKNGHIFISTPCFTIRSVFFDLPYVMLGHKHFPPKTLIRYLEETGFEIEDFQIKGGYFVAVRVSLLAIYKHIFRKALPEMPYIEKRQLYEYRHKKGFNEIFLRARKIKEV